MGSNHNDRLVRTVCVSVLCDGIAEDVFHGIWKIVWNANAIDTYQNTLFRQDTLFAPLNSLVDYLSTFIALKICRRTAKNYAFRLHWWRVRVSCHLLHKLYRLTLGWQTENKATSYQLHSDRISDIFIALNQLLSTSNVRHVKYEKPNIKKFVVVHSLEEREWVSARARSRVIMNDRN